MTFGRQVACGVIAGVVGMAAALLFALAFAGLLDFIDDWIQP